MLSGCDNAIADVVFMVDSSNYVGSETNWQTVRSYLVNIVDHVNIAPDGVRVGVIIYSDSATDEIQLGQYNSKEDLRNRIYRLNWLRGSANTMSAIDSLRTMFRSGDNRDNVQNIGLIFTFGRSNSYVDTLNAANSAKTEGNILYSFGITNQVDENEIRQISSNPQQVNRNYFMITDFNSLTSYIGQAVTASCVTGKVGIWQCRLA